MALKGLPAWFQRATKVTPKRPPPAIAGKPSNARQHAKTMARLGCAGCPLNTAPVKTPKMRPTLAADTRVYFLAEAPGRDEDENTGRPLTGPSGTLLRSCIPSGLVRNCSFDNVVRDRPPENRTPVWQEIECCRGHVIKSIEEAKPDIIVGLGVIPLSWMLGSTDMAGMRGRIFKVRVGNHVCLFMPTYHPSYIIRTAFNKKKPLQSKFGFCFRMDIARACSSTVEPAAHNGSVGGSTPSRPTIDDEDAVRSNVQIFNGNWGRGYRHLMHLLQEARDATVKSIDIETQGLRPFSDGAAILSAAISYDDTNFAFALDHPKSEWSADQRENIGKLLRVILADKTIKVAHNAPFELEWFISIFGKDVVNHKAWQCTQMQAHFLDERRGSQARGDDDRRAVYQGLDFLCRQHFGVAYKSMFKLNKKNMAASDLRETLIYNAVDTKYTLKLFFHQFQLLREQGLVDAYKNCLSWQPTVALMQTLGMDVHQGTADRLQGELQADIDRIQGQIADLDIVRKFTAERRGFNPMGEDLVTLLRDYLKSKEIHVDGRVSTDKSVLDRIDHPIAPLIKELRNKSKLKSTYVDGLRLGTKNALVYPDSKVHTNFNTTFTETGRLSSDGPNLQNFPQRNDAWVRQLIVAPPGHYILAFDYGQLEACTAAMSSKDAYLVKALWEDYDIHMEWAAKLAAISDLCPDFADKKVADAFRSKVKNKLVFPAIFGAQSSSIAGYLNADQGVIDELFEEFWKTFHGLKAWQDRLVSDYYETGYVQAPLGRLHRYPLKREQAINFPIQSMAGEIVCNAMSRLSVKAVETGNWGIHPRLNIHDDLTFVVPDSQVDDAIEVIYKTMLTPPWSELINVPLSVKASLGRDWFRMATIGKFYSNKDL